MLDITVVVYLPIYKIIEQINLRKQRMSLFPSLDLREKLTKEIELLNKVVANSHNWYILNY